MPTDSRPVTELVAMMQPTGRVRTARRRVAAALLVLGVAVSAAVSAALIGQTVTSLTGNRDRLWILGRAAGLTAYALLLLLVALGLLLSHPWRTRVRRPSAATGSGCT